MAALEADIWTAKAIRVLSCVGTIILPEWEAMTRTELATEPIPMSMVQGSPPSIAIGTRVDLSNIDIDLDGATHMSFNIALVNAWPVPVTRSRHLVLSELVNVRRVTLLRVPNSASIYRVGLPARSVAESVLRWVSVRGPNDEILLLLRFPPSTEAVSCRTLP